MAVSLIEKLRSDIWDHLLKRVSICTKLLKTILKAIVLVVNRSTVNLEGGHEPWL